MFRSEGEPRLYYIRDVNVHGVQYLNPEILKSSAGLIEGDSVYLPSNFISNAISRLWERFFSDVKIGAEIEGDSLDLEVFLKERPRVYNWEFEGISKGKKKDLRENSNSSAAANSRTTSSTRTRSSSRTTGPKRASATRRWTCASTTTRCVPDRP